MSQHVTDLPIQDATSMKQRISIRKKNRYITNTASKEVSN